jgi:SAM-dependent methyltransferase
MRDARPGTGSKSKYQEGSLTSQIAADRWRSIIPAGYVGQQSFVSVQGPLAILRPTLHRIASLLDAGCGRGAISCYLAINLPRLRVTGFDINRSAVRSASTQAKKAGLSKRVRFYWGNFERPATLPRGEWDSVISLDALQQVSDLRCSLVALVDRWNAKGPFFATMWCFEPGAKNVCTAWGFPRPWTRGEIRNILKLTSKDLRVSFDHSRFTQRLAGSLSELRDQRVPFTAKWGKTTYLKRLRLETATLQAGVRGLLSQARICGDSS